MAAAGGAGGDRLAGGGVSADGVGGGGSSRWSAVAGNSRIAVRNQQETLCAKKGQATRPALLLLAILFPRPDLLQRSAAPAVAPGIGRRIRGKAR